MNNQKRIALTDDGSLDTVLVCSECKEEFRFNYAGYGDEDFSSGNGGYEAFVAEMMAETEEDHVCETSEDTDTATETASEPFATGERLVYKDGRLHNELKATEAETANINTAARWPNGAEMFPTVSEKTALVVEALNSLEDADGLKWLREYQDSISAVNGNVQIWFGHNNATFGASVYLLDADGNTTGQDIDYIETGLIFADSTVETLVSAIRHGVACMRGKVYTDGGYEDAALDINLAIAHVIDDMAMFGAVEDLAAIRNGIMSRDGRISREDAEKYICECVTLALASEDHSPANTVKK